MANRAYLYFCEDVSALTFDMHLLKSDGSERSYMDSRHQLPLSWFLFFDFTSIRLVPCSDGEWNDLYFVRSWPEARAAFESRIALLLERFEGELGLSDIGEFMKHIESLIEEPNETWLVLDPSELQIDDESGPRSFHVAYSQLNDVNLSARQRYEDLNLWSGVGTDAKMQISELRNRVFGYYYGPPVPGYFLPRQPWLGEVPDNA